MLLLLAAGLAVAVPLSVDGGRGGAPLRVSTAAAAEREDSARAHTSARKSKRARVRRQLRRRSGLYRLRGFKIKPKRQALRKRKGIKRLPPRRRPDEEQEERPPPDDFPDAPPHNPPVGDGPAVRAAGGGDFELFRSAAAITDTDPSSLLDFHDATLSYTAEPAAANIGRVHLLTANSAAVVSTDNGISYPNSLDVEVAVDDRSGQTVRGEGFCCDQVVEKAGRGAGRDEVLGWAMMTLPDDEGVKEENAIVLHTFAGEESLADADEANSCRYVFSPSQFGLGDFNEKQFDRPRLGSTDEHMFLTVGFGDIGVGAGGDLLLRMDLDDLFNCRGDDGTNSRFDAFVDNGGSGYVPVDNADDTMFMARRDGDLVNGDVLRIQEWPDDAAEPDKKDKNVDNWKGVGGDKIGHCDVTGGGNPCKTISALPAAGFRVQDSVGWLWDVREGGQFPFPHVRVAVFDTEKLKLVKEADMWDEDFAFALPAVAVNSAGHIALTMYRMGGATTPRSEAYIVTRPRDGWPTLVADAHLLGSSLAPAPDEWGDYYTVQKYNGCLRTFLATYQTVDVANPDQLSARTAWFGAPGDACADLATWSVVVTPTTAGPGDELQLTAGVTNTGEGDPVSTTSLKFFLSEDDDADDHDDVKIGPTLAFFDIAPQEPLVSGPWTGDVPGNLAPGTYHVLACVDPDDTKSEISDGNNCRKSSREVVSP